MFPFPEMSNRIAVLSYLLAVFCFISWKYSIIGVIDALKLTGRGLIFLGICTWMIYIFPRMKFFFFPVSQELPERTAPEPHKHKEENARRIQQDQHNDKALSYTERVLKPRQDCQQQKRNENRRKILNWQLSPGCAVGRSEDVMGGGDDDEMDVDESPNQGARRRRKLLETLTPLPVQQEVQKQKRVRALPSEPSADTRGVLKIALRCPGRRTIYKRFLKTWSSELLRDWMLKEGFPPAVYALYSSYPRTEVLTAADVSLEEAGIVTNTLLNVEEREPRTA